MDSLMPGFALDQLSESIEVKRRFMSDSALMQTLARIAEVCVETYRKDGKIMIAGNGGSAADAQHFAGELVSRFYFDRPALSALALTTDTSILTSIGNDYGFDDIFARQVYANGKKGDIFIGISTSGNSKNIIKAISACRDVGLTVIGMTGLTGGAIGALCDYNLNVPSDSTPRIQECHLVIEHIVCAYIEQKLFGEA
jgi:D-sedoheptulose 7-phosphate isomerase